MPEEEAALGGLGLDLGEKNDAGAAPDSGGSRACTRIEKEAALSRLLAPARGAEDVGDRTGELVRREHVDVAPRSSGELDHVLGELAQVLSRGPHKPIGQSPVDEIDLSAEEVAHEESRVECSDE